MRKLFHFDYLTPFEILGNYFPYFTERRLALWSRDRKRESWDSSLEKENASLLMPLYFKAVSIISDYQVESHYIN